MPRLGCIDFIPLNYQEEEDAPLAWTVLEEKKELQHFS